MSGSNNPQSTPIQSSIDRMRFELMTLDKLRQTHQIDNPEYIDTIIALFNKQIVAELRAIPQFEVDDVPGNAVQYIIDRIKELNGGTK